MNDSFREALVQGERAAAPYLLGVPRRIPAGPAGMHQGTRSGRSLEFREHRDYQPGDDLRHIDWNAYGRSDQLITKVFQEEVDPRLDLVLDGSRSMSLEGSAKPRAALALAALFATAAANAGFAASVWLAADGCRPAAPAQAAPSTWPEFAFDFTGSMADSFARRLPAWRPRGLRVVISDLLWVGEPQAVLGPFAERASALAVIQLLAAADAQPPEQGNLRLVDSETGRTREVFLDAAARQRYRDNLTRHQENWRRSARQVGAFFTTLIAEEFLSSWRLDELVAANVLRVL